MAATNTFAWHALPGEMKLAILEKLALHDVLACGKADKKSYSACIPLLFRTVRLPSYEALLEFLDTVPPEYRAFIHDLDVCTKSTAADTSRLDTFTPYDPPHATHAIATLLSHCASLEALSLSVGGSLVPDAIIRAFQATDRVKKLRLINWEQEDVRPFSERLAVALAFTLPRLEDLALVRITRSALHAQELAFSSVPLVTGDDDDALIPPHALLGRELRLPQLLRLPFLRRLKIRDTHLGDPLWGALGTPECPLEVLDLGSCAYVSPQENEAHTSRILASVPASIEDFSLSSALAAMPIRTDPGASGKPGDDDAAAGPNSIPPALPHLRTLHLTPLVPTSSLTSTLTQSTLAGSPVHTLSCSFEPDDAADGCAALEAFLRERNERGRSSRLPHTGRKRSGSKLAICATLTEEPEADTPPALESSAAAAAAASEKDNEIGSSTKSDLFDQEAPSSSPAARAGSLALLSPLYPALRTLSIDIPSAPDASQPTATGKLSPRRLAAARRRAEERRSAARRLKALATQLGLDVVVHGIDGIAADSADMPSDLPSAPMVKPTVRGRANSTF